MKNKLLSLPLLGLLMCGTAALMCSSKLDDPKADSPEFHIATWEDFKTAACSFNFDDGASVKKSHTWVANELDKYDFKGTFNLVTNWVQDGDWELYRSLSDSGHEIGSHTVSHSASPGQAAEYPTSKDIIKNHISRPALTLSYPNAYRDGTNQDHFFISCTKVWFTSDTRDNYVDQDGTNQDFFTLPSIYMGSNGVVNSTDGFTNILSSIKNNDGWALFLGEGIEGIDSSYSPLNQDAFKGALEYLKNNDFWVSSTGNITMYLKERINATCQLTGVTSGKYTYSLTLDKSLTDIKLCDWDYPLSCSIDLPSGCTGATITQNGKQVGCSVKDNKVYFKAIPNGGDIVFEPNSLCTITFNANGGTGEAAPVQVESGESYTLPANPFTAPVDKEFDGWKVNDSGEMLQPGAKINVNSNITLVAQWRDAGVTPPGPVNPDNGLSGGAIAGIVIGSVLVATIGTFALVWFVIKKKTWADLIAIFKKK